MKKGSGTVESSRRLGEFFFPAGTFLIDLRPEFVWVGDSFLAAVVVGVWCWENGFPAGDWFRKHSVWISTKRTLGEHKPLKQTNGGDVDEGGDLRQIQQRQSAGGKHRRQLRECKEYADKNGITILCSYIDRALSAKTDNRPEFQKMVQDSAKGLFDTVLVWKLDRFARNRYDSAHYKAVLRRNGVKVVSATENISDGPEGIILESMLEEWRNTIQRSWRRKSTGALRKMR